MKAIFEKINFKIFFIALSILILILMPMLSNDYGQNGDENVEMIYGKDIWKYYTEGNRQALDYDHPPHPMGGNIQGMQYYGGLFDIITESIHHVFPNLHLVMIRHLFASLFGALLMIFTGLLTYRLSGKKWSAAFWALLFMFFSPRIFGESMNNGKDIPFAMGMVMGGYYLVRLIQDISVKKHLWFEAIYLALAWTIVIGTRSAGGLLFILFAIAYLFAYYFFNKNNWQNLKENQNRNFKKLLLSLSISFLLGSILGLFSWPYALQSPINNFFEALHEMSNRTVNIRVLFDGKYWQSTEMPWYYEFKWIFISNPLIVIVLAILFVPLIPKAIKRYSLFSVFVLLFSALFPLLYIIYKHSTVYDTWRHVFFVYPFWVIIAALSLDMVQDFLSEKLRWISSAIAFIALLPVIVWTIRSHPNQYVYFNESIGGPKGALGNYDLDYYHNTGKQMAQWILKNIPKPTNGKKVVILSNMDGMDTYFRNDTSWIETHYCRYYERGQNNWDYYITFGRFISSWQLQNDKWPPSNAIYKVTVPGDVPIGVILGRKNNESALAYTAFKNEQYQEAITHYEASLKVDNSDEMVFFNYAISLASVGRIAEAINAINAATKIDASRPEFYEMQARIYKAIGDKTKEQESITKMQTAMEM